MEQMKTMSTTIQELESKRVHYRFTSANILDVTLECNGPQGGDAGHGCYVEITIKDEGSTDMELNGHPVEEFTLVVRGDSERETFQAAFEMISSELRLT